MTKSEILQRLLDPGVVAIIRADNSTQLVEATEALIEGGIPTVEVTMTTPNALQVIRETTQRFGSRLLMGVGTVLDDTTVRLAVEAGAQFVVTPTFRPSVVAACQQHAKPLMSGAYTPTEALTAHEAGSDFIKIFPAEFLGAAYIKSIRAPLPQLQIIPTGGVTPENCGEFVRAGCVAVGVGSNLVSKTILEKKDWNALWLRAAAFVTAMKAARTKA